MKWISKEIEASLQEAFEKAGYDGALAKVTLSNRPDLCEYQCNGAMAAAKRYKRAPLAIAQDVTAFLQGNPLFEKAEAAAPGFINLTLRGAYYSAYLEAMAGEEKLGVSLDPHPRRILMDYGGPNVAKPLHVGHLRSAIIGESLKRIARFLGHQVISDIHLGDWGYQMGLIITEVGKRHPELPYFDPTFEGDYPEEPPFTIGELEEIYTTASAYAKEHPAYKEEALQATYELQQGRPGYRALWKHIMEVSVADLKKNYQNLQVDFDLWKGEADAQAYIPPMVERLKQEGYARLDQGALVVDVKEETDTKEVPPCMILKSDGAALYDTTDLATLVEREEDYAPDEVLYVVDKRQEMHFVQVFRCAKKTGIVRPEVKLTFLGFGTMNGKDGKPFKTREGGVMRLESLLAEIQQEMYQKIQENRTVPPKEAEETAQIVGLAAIKYGDLCNQASKDYVFDVDRFTSFEGNTCPYILYTIVRIKSILGKDQEAASPEEGRRLLPPLSGLERELMAVLGRFNEVMGTVQEELAPHKLCAYIYEVANTFNRFYHETKILAEEDPARRGSYLALLDVTKRVLETSIHLLGFEAPKRM